MKETKTVRVASFTRVGDKPYYAGTYVVDSDEAAAMIEAGATEIKAPAKAATTNEANEPNEPKTARK